jgi:hypothetical protein
VGADGAAWEQEAIEALTAAGCSEGGVIFLGDEAVEDGYILPLVLRPPPPPPPARPTTRNRISKPHQPRPACYTYLHEPQTNLGRTTIAGRLGGASGPCYFRTSSSATSTRPRRALLSLATPSPAGRRAAS